MKNKLMLLALSGLMSLGSLAVAGELDENTSTPANIPGMVVVKVDEHTHLSQVYAVKAEHAVSVKEDAAAQKLAATLDQKADLVSTINDVNLNNGSELDRETSTQAWYRYNYGYYWNSYPSSYYRYNYSYNNYYYSYNYHCGYNYYYGGYRYYYYY